MIDVLKFFRLMALFISAPFAVGQTLIDEALLLPLSAKQQASLGVKVIELQQSVGTQLLVSASVVTPPGKEFTVSAPYAGQVSKLLVGVGDSFKKGASLAQFTSSIL